MHKELTWLPKCKYDSVLSFSVEVASNARVHHIVACDDMVELAISYLLYGEGAWRQRQKVSLANSYR